MTNTIESYFRGQQVSLQWLPVLRAMASELNERTDAKELRRLFFNIGERFAKETEHLFEDVKSLAQLETSLNEFWSQINWGWVNLTEVKTYIDITHQAAPLAEAFGDEALEWSVGLLEGFYQNVFTVLGASDTMVVRGVDESCEGMDICLRFGRLKN